MDQAQQDMLSTIERAPMPPDDMEYTEEDYGKVYTARWLREDRKGSFSLSFVGEGHVVGCLVFADPKRRGTVWRWALNDERLDGQIYGGIFDLHEGT